MVPGFHSTPNSSTLNPKQPFQLSAELTSSCGPSSPTPLPVVKTSRVVSSLGLGILGPGCCWKARMPKALFRFGVEKLKPVNCGVSLEISV